MITRLEWGEQCNNPRYVETNLHGDAQALYDQVYCQRGEAENRIKEAQVGLFATRTSCRTMRSNQLCMLLAALGYVRIERLRALALQGTALATAQVYALRVKLLKVSRRGNTRHPSHPSVPGLQLTRCRYLRACHAHAELSLSINPAHGLHVDTKPARNPSRGGGRCACVQHHHNGYPCSCTVKRYLAFLQIKNRLSGRGLGICVKYAGKRVTGVCQAPLLGRVR